jgi:hypothetical protein
MPHKLEVITLPFIGMLNAVPGIGTYSPAFIIDWLVNSRYAVPNSWSFLFL